MVWDARYARGQVTVIITNHGDGAAFEGALGSSIASRLNEECGILLCDWPSLRDSGDAKPASPTLWHGDAYRYTPVVPGAQPSPPIMRRGVYFGAVPG